MEQPTQSVRPTWDETNMMIVAAVARRSTCLRIPDGLGAVLVESQSHRLLGVGYTGSLPGQPHCNDKKSDGSLVGCLHIAHDPGCHRTVHAEMNAMLFARPTGVEVAKTLYSSQSPCMKCLQHAIILGVTRFVFGKEYRINEEQRRICEWMGLGWELFG